MTAELPTSLEIKLSPDQVKALVILRKQLEEAAYKAFIPTHDTSHQSQKPQVIKIKETPVLENGKYSIKLTATAPCSQIEECHIRFEFNPEKGEWENPTAFDLGSFKGSNRPGSLGVTRSWYRSNGDDEDLSGL